jgi:uncharacterized cupredoxin-like copper-binding protein
LDGPRRAGGSDPDRLELLVAGPLPDARAIPGAARPVLTGVTAKRQRTQRSATPSTRNAAFRIALLSLTALTAASGAAALGAVQAAPAGAASKSTTVKAVETDFHIKLSKSSFKAGKYVFVVQNKGQTTHALEITGPGLSNATSKDIQPGQSTKLKVSLKKGAYDVFCPVPGHKALGMNMNISVGGATATSKNSGSGGSTGGSAGGGGAAF